MAKENENTLVGNDVKSRRDMVSERLRARHPDEEWADDEALFGRINDDYDAYEKDLSDYKEKERKLADMFNKDPRSAAFFLSWGKNGNPVSELIRAYGKDFLSYAADHPDEMADAEKEYMERVSKEKEYEDEYNKNLDASVEALEALQVERNLDDDTINNAVDALIQMAHDVIMGKFSSDAVDMMLKASGYDQAVASAAHEGEVRGKNSKESERLKLRKKGDGVPLLSGGGGGAPTTPRQSMGALDRADNKTIWERGQEKRVRY